MISIIIPHLNNLEKLTKCLDGLEAQEFDQDKMEIIVVDNGSSQQILNIIGKRKCILLKEPEKSPYKARNRGVLAASHKIIALLDSNCEPTSKWVSAGVSKLKEKEVDIVCGPIAFTFSTPPTITEIADSMVFVPNEESVKDGVSIPTGQLFTSKEVFDRVGLFMDEIRSGGDIEWSTRATKMGFKLGYAPEAEVSYAAKQFKLFTKKARRIGKGRKSMRKLKKSHNALSWFLHILIISRPPSPFSLFTRMKKTNLRVNFIQFWRIWFMTWLYRLVRGYSMLI